jgi:hypothetical protein
VPGERVEELDVLLGRIDPFPAVLADRGDLEEPAGLDPGPVVGQLARPRPRPIGRYPLADLVVDILDFLEERIAAVGRPRRTSAAVARDPRPYAPGNSATDVPGPSGPS